MVLAKQGSQHVRVFSGFDAREIMKKLLASALLLGLDAFL